MQTLLKHALEREEGKKQYWEQIKMHTKSRSNLNKNCFFFYIKTDFIFGSIWEFVVFFSCNFYFLI